MKKKRGKVYNLYNGKLGPFWQRLILLTRNTAIALFKWYQSMLVTINIISIPWFGATKANDVLVIITPLLNLVGVKVIELSILVCHDMEHHRHKVVGVFRSVMPLAVLELPQHRVDDIKYIDIQVVVKWTKIN